MNGERGEGDRTPGAPALARWILSRVCAPEDRAFVLSDLDEEFEERARSGGVRAARSWYRMQAVRSTLPCVTRRLRLAGRSLPRGPGRDLLQDLRYAVRRLVATPVQVLVILVSLGIGIGLTTSVFAVTNAFLFAPPGGIDDTAGLVALFTSDERGNLHAPSSYPDFQDMEAEGGVFEGVTAARPGIVRWSGDDGSERLVIEMVSGSYFDVLRLSMAHGRAFLPEETTPGQAHQVAVVSSDFWEERFDSDPEILGRTLRLDGRDFVVIGVAPEGLLGRAFRLKVSMWVPAGLPGGLYHATAQEIEDRADREYIVVGRLREGVSMRQARERLDVLATRLHEEHGRIWEDDNGRRRSFSVLSEANWRIPPEGRKAMAGLMAFLLAGTGLVLLIACANVAGLFTARAVQRRSELAVRASLGAPRWRILRLLLVEAGLVGLAGGALGLWLAGLAGDFLGAIPLPVDAPLRFGVGVDLSVVLFAVGVSTVACLLFGLAPAWKGATSDVLRDLKGEMSDTARRSGFGLGGLLVVVQVAGSLILLVGAGLFLRSAGEEARLDRGIDYSGIALASVTVREEGLSAAGVRRWVFDIADRVAARPEVQEVSVATLPDASTWTGGSTLMVRIQGYEPAEDEAPKVSFNSVTPSYFDMMGLRASRGRTLEPADEEGETPVMVVNEAFVSEFWPQGDPLGRSVTVLERRLFSSTWEGPSRTFAVVGVVPDVRISLDQAPPPHVWLSYLQEPTPTAVLHARGRLGAGSLVPLLREETADLGDALQLVPPQTYESSVAFALLPQRLASGAMGAAGIFALILAVMGIYGVVSFAVSRRTREMAIRQAMGAARSEILAYVVAGGMRLTGVGLLVGLAVALPGAYLARSAFHGISFLDPRALASGIGILVAAALLAAVVPARRATALDPMAVLREE